MKVVRFKVQHDIYNSGEVAGFPADKAQELVDRKVADYVCQKAPDPAQADTVAPEQIAAELNSKTKAELVLVARERLGLELDEGRKKDELVAAIVAAIAKA